jgi:hypothetical protein
MLYDVIWSCYHHMSSHITTYYRMTSHGINKVACHLSHFLTISEGHYGLMMVCRPYAVICCYMLLYAVICCYMMVYDGIWCYMMLYDVIWCYMMLYEAYHGISGQRDGSLSPWKSPFFLMSGKRPTWNAPYSKVTRAMDPNSTDSVVPQRPLACRISACPQMSSIMFFFQCSKCQKPRKRLQKPCY